MTFEEEFRQEFRDFLKDYETNPEKYEGEMQLTAQDVVESWCALKLAAERSAAKAKSDLTFTGIEKTGASVEELLKELAEVKQQVAAEREARLKAEAAMSSTWAYITRNYGKLQDWARTVLPQPYRDQFFGCIANALWDSSKDVGTPYIRKAAYEALKEPK